MEQVLALLWTFSYKAVIVISMVLLVRGIMVKIFPRKYTFWLWEIVALCLLFPVNITSSLSVFNVVPDGEHVVQMLAAKTAEKNQTIETPEQTDGMQNNGQLPPVKSNANSVQADAGMNEEKGQSEKKEITQEKQQEEIAGKNQKIVSDSSISNDASQKVPSTENEKQEFSLYQFLFWGWIAGILALLLWNLVSWLKIKKQVKTAIILETNVYECEEIPCPFVLGLVSPKIYIPFHIEAEAKHYILAHERYHIKRRDNITKILAVTILAVYWFHPFVWAAYILMCRDMEMSCDEYVLAEADKQARIKYSECLLSFATNKRSWISQRMAFGENTTKQRIKNVLAGKKQKKYMGIIFGAVAVMISIVFLTQGADKKATPPKQTTEKKKTLTELTAFVDWASFSGLQEGWYGELLKERFQVKINIKPSRGEENEISGCDIMVLDDGNSLSGMNFQTAKEQGKLLDLSDGEYGRKMTVSDTYHDDIFYTWDLRYDLYQKCGSPQIKDLNDLCELLKQMKNQSGGEEDVYATSLWSGTAFDDTNLFYARMLCCGYYGLDNKDFVIYNNQGYRTGILDALEGKQPYIQALRFLNQLYREGLLDPKSKTYTYDDVSAKVKNGNVLWSLVNYTGGELYNTEEHLKAGTAMYPVVPADARIATYRSLQNNLVLTVNADTKHPDLCKQIVEYLTSPLGMMELTYGPEGVCWYYDEEGKAHLTETGQNCYEEELGEAIIETKEKKYSAYDGEQFMNGVSQFLFVPYMRNDINTDTGEKYEAKYWKSYTSEKENTTPLWEDWKEASHATQIQTYLEERGNYEIYSAVNSEEGKKPKSWNTVGKIVVQGSWDAVYAESEQAFENCIADMTEKAYEAGYEDCVAYSMKQLGKE